MSKACRACHSHDGSGGSFNAARRYPSEPSAELRRGGKFVLVPRPPMRRGGRLAPYMGRRLIAAGPAEDEKGLSKCQQDDSRTPPLTVYWRWIRGRRGIGVGKRG